MARDLGTKHACFDCGTKFYDLRKPEAICPKCGADPRQAVQRSAAGAGEKRRHRAAEPAEVEAAAESAEEAAVEEDEEDEEDEEEL